MADVNFTDQNFQEEVLNSPIPVLVDFWAEWCTPCKIVTPIVEELAREYEGKLKVGKINVDENQQVSSQFGIMSIPTLLIFKDGQPVKFKEYAAEMGVDTGKFNSCLDSDEHKAEVDKDIADGTAAGVNGTPATFVNGVLVSGAVPFEQFKAQIDAALEE